MFDIDKELREKLVQKDEQAYNVLYGKTVNIFFRYVKSHYFIRDEEVEDILGDFYFKFWRVVSNYNDEFKFETYLWVVFKSVINDHFRKNKHQYMVWEEVLEWKEGNEKEMLDFMEEDFQMGQIQDAMKKLTDSERELLFLKFIEEKTYEELEDFLGISQESLRQRVSRTLRRLKEMI